MRIKFHMDKDCQESPMLNSYSNYQTIHSLSNLQLKSFLIVFIPIHTDKGEYELFEVTDINLIKKEKMN